MNQRVLVRVLSCASLALAACGEETTVVDASSGTIATTSAEPAGENCAQGGVAFAMGVDIDGDGALSAEETASTTYVCNGADGEPGEPGTDGTGSPGELA